MDSGLRITAARAKAWGIGCACALFAGVLQQYSLAQELEFLRPQRFPAGGRLELRTPDGLDCSATAPDRPKLTIGAAVTEPRIINGSSFISEYTEDEFFNPTALGPPEPVAGISISIPFGGASSGNCAKLVEYEEASMRTRKALELYELGLITEDEFKAIGRQAYSILSSQ